MTFDKTIYPVGSIAYYVKREHDGSRYGVWFGIVDDQWFGKVSLHFLTPKRISKYYAAQCPNGATLEEVIAKHCYKKHKLPKGWDCDVRLVEEKEDPKEREILNSVMSKVDIKKPETILDAMKTGYLVRREPFDNLVIKSVVEKDGFYLKAEDANGMWSFHEPTERIIDLDDVFGDYESAATVARAHNDELARQAALSDYDWSVEQIEKILAQWQHFTSASPQEVDSVRKQIMDMKNIEDIECRMNGGNVQVKHWKREKWNTVLPKEW